MRKIYLSNTPRPQALEIFLKEAAILPRTEKVAVKEALGRVTASAVFAALSMPGYHAAGMDGIAVKAEKTFGASDQSPVKLKPEEDFHYVNTGNSLPPGFDAVIKIEDIHVLPDKSVEILAPATFWQHVRPVGEDIVAGEIIVPAHHLLRPPDLGALLAGGILSLEVLAKPKVAIIPSGTEVVSPGASLKKGSVPDFNSTVVAGYLSEWGAEASVLPIVPDEPEKIGQAILEAQKTADLLIVIAGSSAGEKDYTFKVIEELGEVFLHGVATRPGKPTILGKVGTKPVVGLPGYPVSAFMSLEWFVRPLIKASLGLADPKRPKMKVTLGRMFQSWA